MSTISSVSFDLATLKTYNATTQAFEDTPLTGNLYTVAGVTDSTGALRKLSMAELVMVVCLARAAEKEAAVIELMKEMSNTTETLNGLTDIEKRMLDGESLGTMTGDYHYNGTAYTSAVEFLMAVGVTCDFYSTIPGVYNVTTPTDEIITSIEAKMDSLNSFSQQKMIELQSETNKRDQSFDLMANVLKSLNNVQIGIVRTI